jgi:protein-disulfide isomerase
MTGRTLVGSILTIAALVVIGSAGWLALTTYRETAAPAMIVPPGRVVVVEFRDYHCPACRQAHERFGDVLRRLAEEHPGVIEHIVKDYPLDQTCHPGLPRSAHPSACAAAALGRLARARGQSGVTDEWLFSNPDAEAPQIAAAAGEFLGIDDFETVLGAAFDGIRRDIREGKALGVASVPAWFINGRRFPLNRGTGGFEGEIRSALDLR